MVWWRKIGIHKGEIVRRIERSWIEDCDGGETRLYSKREVISKFSGGVFIVDIRTDFTLKLDISF